MVQLKQVSLRLKSITNIQKITKTMKMVSASKFTRAERELIAARPFGYGPRKFYESSQLVKGPVDQPSDKKKGGKEPERAPPPPSELKPTDKEAQSKIKRIYIAMTSDRGVRPQQYKPIESGDCIVRKSVEPLLLQDMRDNQDLIEGLCGGVHTGIARRIRRELAERKGDSKTHKLVCVGDKSRSMLRRSYAEHIILSVKDVGRIVPTFSDAGQVAAALVDTGYLYDIGEVYYNKYYSAVKYELSVIPIFSLSQIESAPNMVAFDDIDSDVLLSYSEWTVAAILYYVLKEGAASEQSARMSAMDSATKNAGEMIKRLRLLFNRTRQSVITRELIEIISGAAALK